MLGSSLELSKLHIGATYWNLCYPVAHLAPAKFMNKETKAFAIVRWVALVWVLMWLPVNTWTWGWQNMLHLCDVSVVVAFLGLWFRNSLLVSSQALLSPLVGILWTLDVCWRIVT